MHQMRENLIKETISEISRDSKMQQLKHIQTAKEVCIPILTGKVYEDAKLESVSKALNFAIAERNMQ
jgi:hypothetical protein